MRVAIMGAGSLGTIIGALMNHHGKAVDLIDVSQENIDALNASGATITGFMELNTPVRAYTPDQMSGKYDLVFLLNKQTTNQIVLKTCYRFCMPKASFAHCKMAFRKKAWPKWWGKSEPSAAR